MSGAITIKRFSSIEEALVVQSLLRANCIYSELDCGLHAQNDWFMQPALGGIGLLVSSLDTREATEILEIEADETETFLAEHWGDSKPEAMDNRRIRKWSFIATYLIYPFAIIVYLMLAGLLTLLENGRQNDRQKDTNS